MRALGLAQPGSISAARRASASAAAYFPVARLLEGEKSIIDESAGSKESFAVENKILKPRNKRKPHAPDRGAVAVPSRVPGLRRDGSAVLPQRGFKVAQHERVVSFLARVVADAHLVRGRRAAAPRAVRQRRVVVRMRAIRLLRALRVLRCRLEVSADASGAARIIARAADDAEEVAGRERVAKVPLELRGLRGTVGARVVQIFRGDYARGASGAGAVRHGAPRIARRRRQGGGKNSQRVCPDADALFSTFYYQQGTSQRKTPKNAFEYSYIQHTSGVPSVGMRVQNSGFHVTITIYISRYILRHPLDRSLKDISLLCRPI